MRLWQKAQGIHQRQIRLFLFRPHRLKKQARIFLRRKLHRSYRQGLCSRGLLQKNLQVLRILKNE